MMKIPLLITALVFGASYSAWATACVSGDTLAEYISDGSCTFNNLTFTFSPSSYVASGSIVNSASDVRVSTATMGDESGLVFNAPFLAPPGESLDADINYTVSCGTGCDLDDWYLAMGGISLGASDSSIGVGETSLQVPTTDYLQVGASSFGTVATAMTTFPPVSSITVDKDLTVIGGSPSAFQTKVSTVTNLFSTTGTPTVPEPSLAILCAGLVGLLPLARRRFIR